MIWRTLRRLAKGMGILAMLLVVLMIASGLIKFMPIVVVLAMAFAIGWWWELP